VPITQPLDGRMDFDRLGGKAHYVHGQTPLRQDGN
jgi:hypothetical protein